MEISKAIVEAVYSKNPPGRFLKKCSETGQWKELSRRDAADKAAQAMAYIIKGESLKEKRRQRRFNLPPSSHSRAEGDNNDVGGKSPQSADLRTRLQQHATKDYLKSNHSSSVAHHGLATWREGAAGTSNDVQPDASDLLHVPPGNSILQQQQLLQQLQQSSTTATLPISAGNSSINQSVDRHVLVRQLMQQQQLPLQYNLVPNPLGRVLLSQTALPPAFNGGLSLPLLNQAQQHQQQQLLQSFLNQQNVRLSTSLPATLPVPAGSVPLSKSAPFVTGPQSQLTNNDFVQNAQQQSNPTSIALLLGGASNSLQHNPNEGIFSAPPYGAHQMDQLQRSLMLQQNNQLLASSVGTSSNIQLPSQQQQLKPLDALLQQTQADVIRRNAQESLPS